MTQLLINLPDGSREERTLNRYEPFTIGSHASSTVVLPDPQAAALVARILWNKKSTAFEITAAGAQLIFSAGQQVRSTLLQPGVEISVADVRLQLSEQSSNSAEETVSSAVPESDDDQAPLDLTAEKTSRKSSGRSSRKKKSADEQQRQPPASVALSKPARETDVESVGQWLTQSRRPGEKDPLRSPLVTTLAVVGFCLLISAAAFYLLIGRQNVQADYAAAKADRDAGKFGPALQRYQQFLSDFPNSSLSDQARIELSLTQIDRALTGAGADLNLAVAAVENFVEAHRERDDYRDWFPELSRYAQRIALAAYRQASVRRDPEFLETGDQAGLLFGRFAATDGADAEEKRSIEAASQQARADLLEFSVRVDSLAQMDNLLASDSLAELFATYRQAVNRYLKFADEPEFIERMQQGLGRERALVRPGPNNEMASQAANLALPLATPEVTLIELSNLRPDVASDEQTVYLLDGESCFGVDRLTGRVRWNVWLGPDTIFEPISVSASHPAWLLPRAQGMKLLLVKRDTGELLWEQTMPSAITCLPTLIDGLIYVVTAAQQLLAISVSDGQIVRQMQFPQPLSAPVAQLSESTLLAIGRQDLFYLIDRTRWECTQVCYYGHAPQTIQVRPFELANQLLIVERDQLQTGSLQVLSYAPDRWNIRRSQQERLPGLPISPPVLWGDRLFLETYGPRIAVWQLSDRPDLPFLQRLTVAPLPFARDTRVFLAPVEGDTLLVAGETVRELTLLTNTFEQRDLSLDLGRASQALQIGGVHVLAAGQQIGEHGTGLLHYDLADAQSYWRLYLGAAVKTIYRVPGQPQRLVCLNARGQQFELSTQPAEASPDAPLATVTPTRTLLSANAEPNEPDPVYICRLSTSNATAEPAANTDQTLIAVRGRQAEVLRSDTLSGTISLSGRPDLPPEILGQRLLWADSRGVHLSSLQKQIARVESWTFPLQTDDSPPPRWNHLVSVNAASFLGLYDDAHLLALQLREEESPFLAQSGTLNLPSPAIGPGCLHDQIYFVACENGDLTTVDATSLVLGKSVPVGQSPIAGPWLVGEQLIVQLADQTIQFRQLNDISQLVWTSSASARVQYEPILLDDTTAMLSLENGQLLIVDLAAQQVRQAIRFKAAISCPPLMDEQFVRFGLANGTVVTLSRQQLLESLPNAGPAQ